MTQLSLCRSKLLSDFRRLFMIMTPKGAISAASEAKSPFSKFKLYENRWQKFSFIVSISMLISGLAIGVASNMIKQQMVALVAVVCLLVSSLFAAVYQLLCLVPELGKLRNIEREVAGPLVDDFDQDIDLIAGLAASCSAHYLEYAAARFSLAARHMRERISILVGALDKVGIVPLAGTAYLTWHKIQEDEKVYFDNIEFVLVGVLGLYLLAIRMTFTVQWLERMTKLYDHAVHLSNRPGRGDTLVGRGRSGDRT